MIRTRQNTVAAFAVTSLVASGAMFLAYGPQVQAQNGRTDSARQGSGMRGGREMNSDRFVQMFEQGTNKKLTAAQKTQLKAAVEKRNRAIRAAQDEFQKSVTKITGVSEQQMRASMMRNRPGGGDGQRGPSGWQGGNRQGGNR